MSSTPPRPSRRSPSRSAPTSPVAAAALDKYGTVERVMQVSDGSYVVHVITANGEVHVLVSKTFEVTGVERDEFPGPGGSDAAPVPDGSQDALPSSAGART